MMSGLNLGWLYTRQAAYPLYCLSGSKDTFICEVGVLICVWLYFFFFLRHILGPFFSLGDGHLEKIFMNVYCNKHYNRGLFS